MKTTILLLFVLQISLLGQLPTTTQKWQELKLVDPSPVADDNQVYPGQGFIHERADISTIANNRLYYGTGPNGHIFSIDPNEPGPRGITDHGNIGNDDNSIIIRAMTSDEYFLYGGTQNIPLLFFMGLNSGSDFITFFGYDQLIAANITILFSAKILETYDKKEIFFGTWTTDSILKIIKWTINKDLKTGKPLPGEQDIIEIIDIGTSLSSNDMISQIGFGYETVGSTLKKVLIIGTQGKKLFSMDLSSNSISDISPTQNVNTAQIVTGTVPDVIWLFNNSTKAYKYNYKTQSLLAFNVGENIDLYQEYLYKDGYIYTHYERISTSNGDITSYGGSSGVMRGRKVCLLGNELLGVSQFDPILTLDRIDITDDSLVSTPDRDFDMLNPGGAYYGGGVIASLERYGNRLIGSINNLRAELIYETGNSEWIFNSYIDPAISSNWTGTSATTLLAYDSTMYYGLYAKPYFAYKDINANQFESGNFIDIQNLINDELQIYIRSLDAVDNYIFIGTGARSLLDTGTSSSLLLYNRVSRDIQKLTSELGSNIIFSLKVVKISVDEYWVYGATGEGIFLYKYPSGELINVENEIVRSISLTVHEGKLILYVIKPQPGYYPPIIRQYNDLPSDANDFLNNGVDLDLGPYNGGYSHTESGKILVGNDDYLYIYYHAWKGSDRKSFLQKININTQQPTFVKTLYDSSTYLTEKNKIYALGIDKQNPDNHDLYVGFQKGRLSRIYYCTNCDEKPISSLLMDNYPNPFNPATNLRYYLEKPGKVKLVVYDILGKEVSILVNEYQNAGEHTIRFDGSGLSSGVYFYSLVSGDIRQTKKFVLMK